MGIVILVHNACFCGILVTAQILERPRSARLGLTSTSGCHASASRSNPGRSEISGRCASVDRTRGDNAVQVDAQVKLGQGYDREQAQWARLKKLVLCNWQTKSPAMSTPSKSRQRLCAPSGEDASFRSRGRTQSLPYLGVGRTCGRALLCRGAKVSRSALSCLGPVRPASAWTAHFKPHAATHIPIAMAMTHPTHGGQRREGS